MKYLLSIAMLLLGAANYAMAQDKLITKDGEIINAWSVDIGNTSIYYKAENTDNAAIKSIAKDKVLIVKKADGTSVNLYENGGDTPKASRQEATHNQQNDANATSESARQENLSAIGKINAFNPEYIGETDKKARILFLQFGLKSNSQIINDDIEIESETGCYSFREDVKKKDFAKTISKHADNERGDLKYNKPYVLYENPALLIRIKNRTGKTLYIDLANTFFSRSGVASPYYVPSSSTSGSSSESGVGVNLGAIAGAAGVGGALGTLASGINVGGSSGSSTANTVYSQRIISIPPRSTTTLDPQLLFNKLGRICDGLYTTEVTKADGWIPEIHFKEENGNKKMNSGSTLDYTEQNSPLTFDFYVTYSLSEDFSSKNSANANYYLRRITTFPWPSGVSGDGIRTVEKRMPDYDRALGFASFLSYTKKDSFPKY